jgi:hypothetical protein
VNTVTVVLGERLFNFQSEQEWINRGQRPWKVHHATNGRAIAIDAKGRICQIGAHFMRATRENAYPVTIYRVQPDAPEHGKPLDMSDEAMARDAWELELLRSEKEAKPE